MTTINYLEEARNNLHGAPALTAEHATVCALLGIGNALMALAERLPQAREWRCCSCKHVWREPPTYDGARPSCPMCATTATLPYYCEERCGASDCPYHPEAHMKEVTL